MKPISLIVATDENNGIGKDGKLLVYLPNDLKWFKKNTLGKKIIMGRKTFESLPSGALPKRTNIVLTRQKDFFAPGCIVVHSLEEALEILDDDKENFVIGGSQIYRLFLPYANKLYITKIHAVFDADTFFPEIDFGEWKLIQKIENLADEKNKFAHDFLIYEKIRV